MSYGIPPPGPHEIPHDYEALEEVGVVRCKLLNYVDPPIQLFPEVDNLSPQAEVHLLQRSTDGFNCSVGEGTEDVLSQLDQRLLNFLLG